MSTPRAWEAWPDHVLLLKIKLHSLLKKRKKLNHTQYLIILSTMSALVGFDSHCTSMLCLCSAFYLIGKILNLLIRMVLIRFICLNILYLMLVNLDLVYCILY
ncbi:hypothetical protein BRARA_J00597 [Brassica rapa]|uniref:Uncharacterized protein n=1 Tax=Brassica campestris TaxID=3711 RepID=A0A397XIK5_BRACM|nr:hypothetical protein BRARA_J00597 [Brassica rapa]